MEWACFSSRRSAAIRLGTRISSLGQRRVLGGIGDPVLFWQAYPQFPPENSAPGLLSAESSPSAGPGTRWQQITLQAKRSRVQRADTACYFLKLRATISATSRTSIAVSGSSLAVSSVIMRMQKGQ